MRIRQLLAISTLVGISACSYTLEEVDYTVDIKRVEPSAIISLEDYADQDTIYLGKATEFQYKIEDVDVPAFSSVVINFGDEVFGSVLGTSGSFMIAGPRLKTGTYKLKITFKMHSGSGSLADRAGNEFVEVWREWVLIIDVDLPPVPVLTKSVENGFLKISWPKYTRKNFVKYQVSFPYHPYFYNQYIDITDPNQTSFIDTTYSAGYGINVAVTVQNEAGVASDLVNVNEEQSFNYVYNADSSVDMKWRKVKYYGAFKSFVIAADKAGASNPKTTTITNASDTTLHVEVGNAVVFPHSLQVSFRMLDKFDVERYATYQYINNPTNAQQTQGAEAWYYNPTLGKLMAYAFGQVRIVNPSSLEVERVFYQGNFSMPWPGRFMYYPAQGAIAQRNLVTDEVKLTPVPGVYAAAVTPRAVIGADNNLVNYDGYDLTEFYDWRFVRGIADVSTNTILQKSNGSWDPKMNNPLVLDKLSDDGRYVFAQYLRELYSVSGATRTYIGSFDNLGGFYAFRPDNNDEVITRQVPTNILKSSDMSILRTLTLPEPGYILGSYDPVTKHILYFKFGADRCYLVNIDTGISKLIQADAADCILINGFLINRGGLYLKVL